jgi:hypothetical protein
MNKALGLQYVVTKEGMLMRNDIHDKAEQFNPGVVDDATTPRLTCSAVVA